MNWSDFDPYNDKKGEKMDIQYLTVNARITHFVDIFLYTLTRFDTFNVWKHMIYHVEENIWKYNYDICQYNPYVNTIEKLFSNDLVINFFVL